MPDETQNEDGAGFIEVRSDAGKGGAGVFRYWMNAIRLADKTEKMWRMRATLTNKRFRDEEERRGAKFNILFSSVQTQEPAMYNSTPIPDVRRRFSDDDPVGKKAAEVFERTLSHCIDDYDFDTEIEGVVHDSLTVGRGMGMVVYEPMTDDTDEVVYETVKTEHIQWEDVRLGPAKVWEDVPWVAVRYRITREEAIALNPTDGKTVNLDHIEEGVDKNDDAKGVPDSFKRLTVWKIWDKGRREIVFIAPSHNKGAFSSQKDDLNLEGFYPFPRPMYDITDPNSLIPLIPYDQYRDQAEELDRVTRRIHALVNVLKWRGIRPASIPELDSLKDAEDGDLIPSESFDALMMSENADADKVIWLMPIDRLIIVIRELVVQREAIKQTVFEISGLADIMRGETNPNETLGAQQIKAQWGSLRMQRRQRDVQRFCRDLIRLKAEVIGEQFGVQTLQLISGIKLMTAEQKQQASALVQTDPNQAQAIAQQNPELVEMMQQPTWEEVKAVMGSDEMRSYRVDIETDSTIQADVMQAQQNMGQFVEGLASFTAAVGPAVESGFMKSDVVSDILVGFARNYKLGRQAEDALERMGEDAKKNAGQPRPEDIAAQQAQQAEQQAAQADAMEKERTQQAKSIENAKKADAEAAEAQRQARADAIQAERDGLDMAEREADRILAAEKRDAERAKMNLEVRKMEIDVAKMEGEHRVEEVDEEMHERTEQILQAMMETLAASNEQSSAQTQALTEAVSLLAGAAETMATAALAPRTATLTKDSQGNKIATSEVMMN